MSLPANVVSAVQYTEIVGTTSSEILPAFVRRRYASISNSGASGVWVAFGEPAVVGNGVYIPPNGGQFIIDGDNRWKGAVNGITAAGTSLCGAVDLY